MQAWRPTTLLILLLFGCGWTPPSFPRLTNTRADGATRLTVAPLLASDQNACFSPDGTFVIFTRFKNGYNRGPAHIMRLDLGDGATPQALTEGGFDDVNVPFGCFDRVTGRVVFASDRENVNEFWTVNPDPAHPDLQRITSHGEEPVWIEPVFSPDGQWVAFESSAAETTDEAAMRGQVVKVRITDGLVTTLTNSDGQFDDRLPSWSPDGRSILYQHRNPAESDSLDRWAAYVIPAEGGEPTNISALAQRTGDGADTDLSWTADGRYVLTSASYGDPSPSIFMLPVAGGSVVRVTQDPDHEDGAPCGAPDGTRVAFESHRSADENSQSDLWIISTPAEALPAP
jgi:Tol biopolymer transport system component